MEQEVTDTDFTAENTEDTEGTTEVPSSLCQLRDRASTGGHLGDARRPYDVNSVVNSLLRVLL